MHGKKSPTIKPTDFSNDLIVRTEKILAEAREGLRLEEERQTNTEEQNSSKQHISEAQPARRPASSAPAPIVPVGGVSYRPPRPKRTQMPMDWPAYYPNHLIPQTEKVVAEAVKKFPEQSQITELCEFVVSTLTPDFCAAIEAKSLRADLASYRMDNLLDCLLGYNCEDLSKRYQVKKIVVNSDEWKALIDEIARVHSAGRLQSQPGETTGHKDAKPATEPLEEESEKHRPKEFEGLPKKPETEAERLIDAARLTDKQRTCALLRWVYNLPVAEIARRIEKDRGTAYKHLSMAERKIETHKDKIRKGRGINTPPEGPPR